LAGIPGRAALLIFWQCCFAKRRNNNHTKKKRGKQFDMRLPTPLTEHTFAKDVFGDSAATILVSHLDQMAYCSIAMPGVMSLGIADWVAEFNAEADQPSISGMLMWEGRLMIHWLEGPPMQLDALWAKIQNDSGQHCLVPLLRRRDVAQRLFATWQMQAASRNEMMAIVREAKEQASQVGQHDCDWQHAISTLSILLDPDLTDCYAQAAKPQEARAMPERQAYSA
jgi:Sensors of blue-light using FAD